MDSAIRPDRRATLIGATSAIALFSIGRARAAADFTYKFATNVPASHP